MKESILSIVLTDNISYIIIIVLTRKNGEKPTQAYPYCEMDEGSICHWWITGKALLEDEIAARILVR